MVNASKILTVSYGTFSCTLEGFDDPFSTMKDISEYFRDLASEDRFFGAEPPKLDAEMLRHIAEMNTHGSVSAEMGPNAVTLRPTLAPTATPVAAPVSEAPVTEASVSEAPVSEAPTDMPSDIADGIAAEPVETPTDADAAAEVAADAAFAEAAQVEPALDEDAPAAQDMPEDVAALTDPEAGTEVFEAAAEDDAEDDFAADSGDTFADIEAAAEIEESDIEEEAPAAALYETDDLDAMMDAPMMAATPGSNDVVVPISEMAADMVAAAAAPLPDEEASVADRLARIRAVVAQEADDSEAALFEETYSEDQHAEEISQSAEDTIAALLADDILVAEATDIEDDFEDVLDEVDMDVATDAEAVQVVEAFEDMAADDDAYDDAVEDDVMEDAPSEAETEEAYDADADDWITADEDKITPEVAPVATATAAPIVRAFVTRVRKTDAAPAPTDAVDPAEAVQDAAELSEEDEAALLAELVKIEVEAAPRRAAALPPAAAQDEADLKRLFEATKTKFDGPETSRVHANISHLKAAVAARNADAPNASRNDDDETEAYREDLASAVKPHHPRVQDAAQDTAPSPRIAPLVLVSEQRVDATDDADGDDSDDAGHPVSQDQRPGANASHSDKVLPRRVRRAMTDSLESDHDTLASVAAAAGRGTDADAGSDFEDFAAELGATTLVDILEAAAAYSQLVQGRESFSRPKLLHLAMEADENFSREEGLRSFGQLLRNGTIKKIKRGSFELTRTSRYAEPASKRAAG